MTIITEERRAQIIGKVDTILTVLFAAVGFALTELVSWAITALPMLDNVNWGNYSWAKVPLMIAITAFLKGLDRQKHESPGKETGLINLPKSLTE